MRRTVGRLDAAVLLDQLADAVVVADTQGVIQYVNSAATRMLGWRGEELTGQPLTVLIPERLHPAHTRGFQRYLETHRTVLVGGPAVRVPARRRDGSQVQVELTIGAHEQPYGDQLFVATLRDVSERVELERRLALTDYLQATLDVATALSAARGVSEGLHAVLPALMRRLDWELACLWLIDDAQEHLEIADTWNAGGDAAAAFVEASRSSRLRRGEGLPGRAWLEEAPVLAPELDRVLVARAEVASRVGLRCGVAFPLLGGERVLGVVELFSRGTGALDAELPVVLAAVGRQLGQFFERVRAEEQIRRSEGRYRSLVAATALDVWRASATGQLLEDMPKWRAVTGQTREELLAHGWLDAVVPEDRERIAGPWRAAVAAGEVYEAEYRIREQAGGERVISVRGVPVTGDGLGEYVGVCVDVT
ncbi:MAG: PAS domain S-box protein, partial [Actinomycetota bacterium]|nr:PAS domain S-box protein [Actinomycetota bacterium]